jgi:murein peptide amidase A
MSRLLLVALLLCGCVARRPISAGNSMQSPVEPEVAAPVTIQKEVIGTSLLGRAIEIEYFRGPAVSPFATTNTVLILGGVHGDEVGGIDCAVGLADLLRADPKLIPPGRTVAIMPVCNPDGYAKRTRSNSRGIDINRNFPAKNFRAGGGAAFRGGKEPASEPETQAILSAIAQLRPRLIVSIHSIRGGKKQNNYDGPAESAARLMSQHNGYPATANIGYPTPGSLGSYAGIDLQIPIVTLEVPREQPGAEAWNDNREALLAVLRW